MSTSSKAREPRGGLPHPTLPAVVALVVLGLWMAAPGASCAAGSTFGSHHGLLFFTAVVFASSVGAGVAGSLLGLGGGIVVIPVLTLGFGVHIRYAIGASVVSIIATSLGGASSYLRDRLANPKVAIVLELGTTVGALIGAHLSARVRPGILFLVFGIVLLLSMMSMIRRLGQELPEGVVPDRLSRALQLGSVYFDRAMDREVPYEVTRTALALVVMIVAGIVSGLLGIGSGSFKVPAMDVAMQLPMKVSSATSNLMIGVTGATSAWVFFNLGYVHPLVAAPVALGCLLGSQIGSWLMRRLSNRAVRLIFLPVIAWVAYQMIAKGLSCD